MASLTSFLNPILPNHVPETASQVNRHRCKILALSLANPTQSAYYSAEPPAPEQFTCSPSLNLSPPTKFNAALTQTSSSNLEPHLLPSQQLSLSQAKHLNLTVPDPHSLSHPPLHHTNRHNAPHSHHPRRRALGRHRPPRSVPRCTRHLQPDPRQHRASVGGYAAAGAGRCLDGPARSHEEQLG